MIKSPLSQISEVSQMPILVVHRDCCPSVGSTGDEDLIIVWIWDGTGIPVSRDKKILLCVHIN